MEYYILNKTFQRSRTAVTSKMGHFAIIVKVLFRQQEFRYPNKKIYICNEHVNF